MLMLGAQRLRPFLMVCHSEDPDDTKEEDFLKSSSIDFHPADILEDADGSLLLLDTGGWLSWGCPHSQI